MEGYTPPELEPAAPQAWPGRDVEADVALAENPPEPPIPPELRTREERIAILEARLDDRDRTIAELRLLLNNTVAVVERNFGTQVPRGMAHGNTEAPADEL